LNNKERIMPKMKTNRGAAKRFKATGSGKIRRSKAFTSHILTSKSTKRKRNLRQSGLIDAADTKAVRRMLPYL
jgi:large subunit ribosomal protein L35